MIAGCFLKKKGFNVLIIDKNKNYGGKYFPEKYKDITYSKQPFLVYLPDIQKQILNELEINISNLFEKMSPSYKIFFHQKEITFHLIF